MPPPPSAATTKRLQRGGARGRARTVAEERGRERVADLDQLAAQAEAGVDDDAGEEEAADQILERVPALHRLVAHRQPRADEQEQHQERVGGDQADLPQPRHLRVARELRGCEHGLADQLERRVERVEHEPLEPVVDRLADPAGQIPEVRMARLVAADGPAAGGAGVRRAAAGRPGYPIPAVRRSQERSSSAARSGRGGWRRRERVRGQDERERGRRARRAASLGARLIRRRSSG